MQRIVAAAKTAVERARRQAELDAPLTGNAAARLEALPSDRCGAACSGVLPLGAARRAALAPACSVHPHSNTPLPQTPSAPRQELAAARAALEDELAAIVCNNPRALEEYTARARDITEMASEVGAAERALGDIAAEIGAITATWLPELQRVVASVNETFSAAFRDIGCAGEVALDTADGEDYAKFAIQARGRGAVGVGRQGVGGQAGDRVPARLLTCVADHLLQGLAADAAPPPPPPTHPPADQGQVPRRRGPAAAHAHAPERRRAQREHDPVPRGAAGGDRDPLPRGGRDQPGHGRGERAQGVRAARGSLHRGGHAAGACAAVWDGPAHSAPRTPAS